MWVKRHLPEELTEGLDPEQTWYWAWEGEGPPPEGTSPYETNQPQGEERITDPIMDVPLPRERPLMRIPTEDPIETILRESERAAAEPAPSLEDVTHTTNGKIPQTRNKLPSFTEEFSPPIPDVEGIERIEPRTQPGQFSDDTSRAVTDVLAAPFQRARQAATGRMTETQQQEFAISSILGALGGGLVGGSLGSLIGAAQATDNPPTTPQALVPFQASTIDTLGGPVNVTAKDVALLGGVAAFTLGMAFGPQAAQKFFGGAMPRLKSLLRVPTGPRLRPTGENAAPGTMSTSNVVDLIRTYDDVNAPLRRIMRRSGVDPVTAERVAEVFRIQTRTTTNALTDAAVSEGRMTTPSYQFQVKVPLAKLKQVENQDFADYLHVLDTIDDIKIQSLLGKNINNPQAGPIVIRGMDQLQADQVKRALEAANPAFKKLAKEYNANLRAMRKFESDGEYATIPLKSRPNTPILQQRSRAFLNANRPYEVPWRGGRVTGEPVDRGSPITALSEYMRERLRARMENEAVGLYVDEMRKIQPDLFKRITRKDLKENPNWTRNVVEFRRRGKLEMYTTDPLLADTLRMDPYYMTGAFSGPLYTTKRLMEITTTGELAPWFAPTSAFRNFMIGRQVASAGRKPPSVTGTIAAIPEQLGMEIARVAGPWMGQRLNNASGGWLGQVFGQAGVKALGQRLATAYERSFYAQLQGAGGGRGSIMQQQVQENSRLITASRLQTANRQLDAALKNVGGAAKAILNGYRNLLNSIHNAPSYSYARRNRGRANITQIAREARHMTGDPRVGGQYYAGSRQGSKPIRFENEASRVSHTLGKVAQSYGVLTEWGRTSAPWFNATVQGVKRIGEAYLEDPVKFTGRLWLYQIMPAASIYYYNRSLGKDPNGVSYVEHQMQRRSEYDKLMNQIIYIPGRPVAEGIRFPRYHETSIAGHMTEVALDHAFRSNIHDLGEDFRRAGAGFLEIMIPATPPVLNLTLATQGMVAPSNPFMGEAFRRRNDPYDQNGGLPGNIELYARAIAPGIGDIVGEGYAAATQTPEGFLSKAQNGAAAMARRTVQKTPFVRDVVGQYPAATGNTAITDELFKKQRVIRDLQTHYRKWVKSEGQIGVRPRSITGEIMATSHLGPRPPTEPAGISQPPPTNPLYNAFIQMMHDRLLKDAPWTGNPNTPGGQRNWASGRTGQPTGAIGQLSIWQRYGIATENIQRLRKVNEGNMVTWQRQLLQRPEQTAYLRERGIDPMKLNEVRNFYERQRQDAARTLLFNIKMVEAEMSELAGRPVKLEDLHPYKKPFEDEQNTPPELPEIGDESLLVPSP